ncbi:MAG: nucleotidyltransferase substrate binding protein [Magnetococcales bacterium]|nr:nucleotidyltransferase substrate binding protein [Magnetococcales bacterium]
MTDRDIRWKQRFNNFDRAFILLREIRDQGFDSLPQISKEGVIQRFEYTYELAWKTLKDYLEGLGVNVQPIAPRTVIKAAFVAGVIHDGQVWIDMMNHRNQLSHSYDFKVFEEVLRAIDERYFAAFERLHDDLLSQTIL